MCEFLCVRAHVSLNKDVLKFKIELYKHNETLAYKFSLYYACAGVTFGHVELTVANVYIAICIGSMKIYKYIHYEFSQLFDSDLTLKCDQGD